MTCFGVCLLKRIPCSGWKAVSWYYSRSLTCCCTSFCLLILFQSYYWWTMMERCQLMLLWFASCGGILMLGTLLMAGRSSVWVLVGPIVISILCRCSFVISGSAAALGQSRQFLVSGHCMSSHSLCVPQEALVCLSSGLSSLICLALCGKCVSLYWSWYEAKSYFICCTLVKLSISLISYPLRAPLKGVATSEKSPALTVHTLLFGALVSNP